MYGTQAGFFAYLLIYSFENDVNMYGTQAVTEQVRKLVWFENDVNMYGTQAVISILCFTGSLRMM